ncbi:sporulation and spore germination protein [Geothermobacter ehrlichii]|uniref:Sporulation and spore germination protein n=1 Tax=Geothermobacter ehrlichii TaxID=213224 RepID=A0A5D3WID0_9BACT|nr:GerMN domain-containing protein [Geothermobacter ehrlichii]TYO96700.1 sporulation and spore germination protein [Geothermobacter ehrlichii]
MPVSIRLFCFCLLLFLLPACEQPSPEPAGKVNADAAYREFFGAAPKVRAGTAWARVGFLPRTDGSGRLQPLPFFLYRQDGQLQLLLDQLTGPLLRPSAASGLFNPFPPGSRAVTANRVGNSREINLTLPAGASGDLDAMAAVLIETAARFAGVERVALTLDGRPWPGMPEGGFVPRPDRIADPGPPRPLAAYASLAAGQGHPPEILVYFDRPVSIERFRLFDADGAQVTGDSFQSVFDMAVVIHTKQPSRLQVGAPLKIGWQARDAKGRQGRGEVVLPLQGRGG